VGFAPSVSMDLFPFDNVKKLPELEPASRSCQWFARGGLSLEKLTAPKLLELTHNTTHHHTNNPSSSQFSFLVCGVGIQMGVTDEDRATSPYWQQFKVGNKNFGH